MSGTPDARLAGRVALVTGAASGIGRATTLRLAREGASVLAVDIDEAGLSATAEAADGGVVGTRRTDVTAAAECAAAVAEAVERFGHLDILGNVAGIARGEHFGEVTEAAYRQMMAVNVDGYFFMAQAAIPALLQSEAPGGGVIVNVASNAGLLGQAYTVVYCMTKGAVVQLTKALAMEFLKQPLRVVGIAPGGVDTGLVRGYQMPADVDWDLVMRYTAHRGMASPDDMANLFAFLVSDEARNIHGTVVSSDGGMTAG